jgi:hypothetical protein
VDYLHEISADNWRGILSGDFSKIIEAYDGNGDGICYRAMNKQFQPTATDIASYVQ